MRRLHRRCYNELYQSELNLWCENKGPGLSPPRPESGIYQYLGHLSPFQTPHGPTHPQCVLPPCRPTPTRPSSTQRHPQNRLSLTATIILPRCLLRMVLRRIAPVQLPRRSSNGARHVCRRPLSPMARNDEIRRVVSLNPGFRIYRSVTGASGHSIDLLLYDGCVRAETDLDVSEFV